MFNGVASTASSDGGGRSEVIDADRVRFDEGLSYKTDCRQYDMVSKEM